MNENENATIEGAKIGRVYTKAEVQNRKTSAGVRGVIVGALSALAIGILVKKTTKANIVDGAEKAFDKTAAGISAAVKKAADSAKKRKANAD